MLSSPDLLPITAILQGEGVKILVYSCYFGQYEPFNPKATGDGAGYDRVVVIDQPLSAPGLRLYPLALPPGETPALGGTILSRWAKLCPHRFFVGYDWVIYIDNSATLLRDPAQIIADIEADQGGDAPPGAICFRTRTCAHREARLCMKKGRIPRALAA